MVKIRRISLLILYNLAVVILIFLIAEGLSSTILIVREAMNNPIVAERLHTQYDEELGWTNLPDLYIKDMYGPGVYLKTNVDQFRNNQNFSQAVPDGKIRAICSGDSFTFGYGVSNDDTWCQLLVSINEKLETINMGQGGYGVDQAYLWYKRQSPRFDHDIHIFTFITPDFERMRAKQFLAYGKPRLAVRDGELVTENIPVPRRPFYVPWLTRNQNTLSQLNIIQLFQSLFFQPGSSADKESDLLNDDEIQKILSKIFLDLKQINRAKDSTLVVVYLPTRQDYGGNTSDPWREFLYAEAAKNGWIFFDLITELNKLPSNEIDKLFIPKGAINYYYADGHYTKEGNAYIANVLYEKLLTHPEIISIFQQ